MKNKFLCVHGHFYQPPRENPWLGAVEPEESAHPYRDWNEKIFQECYGPNSACPLLDENGLIVDMADNYRRMSFNFGPTLLSWLEREHPLVYRAIIEADKQSCAELGGHGNALAQPYYHAILPLQSARDKKTLVRWGLEDFRRRFGREAEGLWLPETAVDEETLEVLIEEGVRFTILAPRQAARVRDLGSADWKEVTQENLLPTLPYRWVSRRDPSRHIAIFFYHRVLHEEVDSGEAFKADDTLFHKVNGRFMPDDSTQLVSVATDGEFYGHHRRAGAAALAETFRLAQSSGLGITNYSDFLSRFPPPQEVEIRPRTAWSCEHGLGRWSADCGCRLRQATSQAWRAPLRAALDWLAAEVDALYTAQGGFFFKDFRAAREDYAKRLGDPGPQATDRFLEAHALAPLSAERRSQALTLLEMQKSRLAMFTSCGWFYDDVAGLESVLILKHAARAVELAESFGASLSDGLKERLLAAASNSKALPDGAKVYERLALSSRADLSRAAAHFALLAHLDLSAREAGSGFCAERSSGERLERQERAGRDRSFSWGVWEVQDRMTGLTTTALTAVHQEDRVDLRCWVGRWPGADKAAAGLAPLFQSLEREELDRELSKRFSGPHFGLDALFAESRLNAMRQLLPAPLERGERKALRQNWARALALLRKGGQGDDVLELLLESVRLKVPCDQLPWISEVRSGLMRQLEALIDGPTAERLSRAARWIEVFEGAGLHADVWELQQFLWRWRAAMSQRAASPLEREAAQSLGEKLRFSSSVLAAGEAAPR
ncbi:MAG: DUF3536 domain-containing protein [Elusimicrobia bacterium]|nr:DUF3536 domain-containing protein [Elusimicrobiota bacterium]